MGTGRDNVGEELFIALIGDARDLDGLRKALHDYKTAYPGSWRSALRQPLCSTLLCAMQEACDYTDAGLSNAELSNTEQASCG